MARPDDRARAARRELDRLKEEGGLFALSGLKARSRSLKGHFAAADADRDDRIEVWGTRIGRILGAIALVVLCFWLVGHLGH
ncbi:MAG: hypothetical protein ACTHJ3_09625 [Pararhizobium sp.]